MAIPAILGAATRVATAAGAGSIAGEAAGAASAGRAVSQLGQAVGMLGQSAQHAKSLVGGLASTITGQFTKALTMAVDVIGQAAAPIESLVRVANPAMADAFGRAMSDAYGIIGQMLLPVMESFIGVARKVGDTIAGFQPVVQPAINAVAKLVEILGDEFVKTLRENAPLYEMLADMFGRAAVAAGILAKAVGEFVRLINSLGVNKLARFAGFTGAGFDPNASAVGAAARHAQFVQPKAIADEAIKNSLMMGVGQRKAKDLGDLWDKLHEIYQWLIKRFGQVEQAREGFVEGAGSTAESAAAAGLPGGASALSFSRFLAARKNR